MPNIKKNKINLTVQDTRDNNAIWRLYEKINPDIIIPASIHAYYGNNHHLEISLGQTFTSIVLAGTSDYNPERKSSLSAHATIGYRYKKKDKAMVYKIAYSPIIENNTTFRHWFLFALGFAF